MKVVDLKATQTAWCEQAARLLVEGFREMAPDAWPDMAAAREEVAEALEPGKICRVALLDGDVVGWIGGLPEYDGNAWELHPLVVDPARWEEGIGRILVTDFEEQVRQRGGITVYLGTDDANDMTSLSGVDLYPDVWTHVAAIENRRRHPYEFYQKLGYVIVGVVPDANGFGRPDIMMAKRVGRRDAA